MNIKHSQKDMTGENKHLAGAHDTMDRSGNIRNESTDNDGDDSKNENGADDSRKGDEDENDNNN